jgi:hypothetical protein
MILRLARSEPVKPAGRTYDEQYAWLLERTDPASSFERAFLDHLYERKLRLPDFAQYTPVPDVFVQPDFYYQRGTVPGICIFIDGPYHDAPARREEDQQGREAFEDRGHRVIEISAYNSLAEQIGRHSDVLDTIC